MFAGRLGKSSVLCFAIVVLSFCCLPALAMKDERLAVVLKKLSSSDPSVRCAAATELREGNFSQGNQLYACASHLAQMLHAPDVPIRRCAAYALARYNLTIAGMEPVLLDALSDSDPKQRRLAAFSLRRLAEEMDSVPSVLEAALRDKDPEVASEARSAIDIIESAPKNDERLFLCPRVSDRIHRIGGPQSPYERFWRNAPKAAQCPNGELSDAGGQCWKSGEEFLFANFKTKRDLEVFTGISVACSDTEGAEPGLLLSYFALECLETSSYGVRGNYCRVLSPVKVAALEYIVATSEDSALIGKALFTLSTHYLATDNVNALQKLLAWVKGKGRPYGEGEASLYFAIADAMKTRKDYAGALKAWSELLSSYPDIELHKSSSPSDVCIAGAEALYRTALIYNGQNRKQAELDAIEQLFSRFPGVATGDETNTGGVYSVYTDLLLGQFLEFMENMSVPDRKQHFERVFSPKLQFSSAEMLHSKFVLLVALPEKDYKAAVKHLSASLPQGMTLDPAITPECLAKLGDKAGDLVNQGFKAYLPEPDSGDVPPPYYEELAAKCKTLYGGK